jgi:hypothetical protein
VTIKRFIFILSAIIALVNNEGMATEYTSYFFTPSEVEFFAYEDGTNIELTDSEGIPIKVDPELQTNCKLVTVGLLKNLLSLN